MAGGERRMKIWLWVLGAVIVALVAALVVVLVTDDDDSTTTTTTTHATTTTSSPSTTSTTAPASTTSAPPTPTTVPLPVITDNPQTYAQYLFATWQNDDRTAAATVASPDAVAQMFSRTYPAQGPYTFANCGPAAGSLYCTWNGPNRATVEMAVRTLTGGLPIQVESVTFTP